MGPDFENRVSALPMLWYGTCSTCAARYRTMFANSIDPSVSEIQALSAFGGGLLLVFAGASRRSYPGLIVAAAGAPLLYRGLTGRWPEMRNGRSDSAAHDTNRELSGDRGIHVREAIRLEKPIAEVFEYWRSLERLPEFMQHLESVTSLGNGRSHWVARGPAELRVEWDAELINEVPDKVIAWKSVEGSDIVTAGSVNFDRVRGGRGTEITVHLQYLPPAGRAGDFIASLFGRAPSQTIREDLRRFKQLLEAGEIATAEPASMEGRR
jgi:uncharacterized membrane protein